MPVPLIQVGVAFVPDPDPDPVPEPFGRDIQSIRNPLIIGKFS